MRSSRFNRRASFISLASLPVIVLGLIGGLAIAYTERPLPLCMAALIGCLALLLALANRAALAHFATQAFGERSIAGVQSNACLGTLSAVVLLGVLVWMLWPDARLWAGYATLLFVTVLCGCAALRLHPSVKPKPPEGAWVSPAHWVLNGAAVLSLAIIVQFAPGDIMRLAGATDIGASQLLSKVTGLERAVREEGEQTRDSVADEGTKTREHIDTRMDRLEAILAARESEPRSMDLDGRGIPSRPALSDEDRRILEEAKPSADALTRYRIEVAMGNDEAAAAIEHEVQMLMAQRRAREDFLFHRARGDRHYFAGRFDEAIQAYRMADRIFSGDPYLLTNLGHALIDAGLSQHYGSDLREAELLFAQALSLFRKLHDGDHPDIAQSLNSIALVRQSLGRSMAAETLFVQALEMRQRLFTGDHPDIAMSMNNLAFARQSLGRAAEAEILHEQALKMQQRLFTGDHPAIATSLNNLATALLSLGRAAEAEPLHEQSLKMRKRLFPNDHPHIAMSLNNLATVRLSLGRAAEAEPLFVQALKMQRRLFTGDHPDTARSLNNLAGVLQSLGRASEAQALYEHSLEMLQRLFTGDHPNIAQSLNNLGYINGIQGHWAEAVAYHELAVTMGRRCLPAGHTDLLQMEANLANARAALNRE